MKLYESILKNLNESEGQYYEVVVNFAGFIGADQEYNVYAMSKNDAVCEALDNPGSEAEMELSADEIEDNGDGTYDVTVSFAGFIGADNTYTITAEDEDEAEMLALEEAKADLTVITVDGEEFNYDDVNECAKAKKGKKKLKESTDLEEVISKLNKLIDDCEAYPEDNPGFIYHSAIEILKDAGKDNLVDYLKTCDDKCDTCYIENSSVIDDLEYVVSELK